MPKTTITGSQQADRPLADTLWNWRAELLWGFAVAVVLFAVVDPVLLIAALLTIATIAAAWLGCAELLRRADRDDAAPASPRHDHHAGAIWRL